MSNSQWRPLRAAALVWLAVAGCGDDADDPAPQGGAIAAQPPAAQPPAAQPPAAQPPAAQPTAPLPALAIGWSASASALPSGTTVTYRCLPGGSSSSVYGTDVYTADSSICGAAVHAGKTTYEGAVDFTIRVGDGAAAFLGSTRNGVTSRNYGPYAKTFRFTP